MPRPQQAEAVIDLMETLSALLLSEIPSRSVELERLVAMNDNEFDSLVALAHSNHVVIRGMEAYRSLMLSAGEERRAQHAEEIVAAEEARIGTATTYLREICDTFVRAGMDVTVIKTLDHWPDFGSDIDLYTSVQPAAVRALMQKNFDATIAARSWGDRLACKWNFEIPGLPEAVEIHMCRLGQTGEQLTLAANVPARSRILTFAGNEFPVTAPSDRIMISTLQRMYRHFYFRLCDIVDSAALAGSGTLDYADLQRSAQDCGIWEGTATYLVLVSDYVKRFNGIGIELPSAVRTAARFDGSVMYTGGSFLRVPIMPQSAGLYQSQLLETFRRGEVHSGARLSILPWLATAAAIGYKITGSDKGIW